MLNSVTDREPTYIGKPEPTMVDIVREKFGNSIEETIVVVDHLHTDIATGLNAIAAAACVLTCKVTKKDIQNGDINPTMTFDSVLYMYKAIVNFKLMSKRR